MVHSCRLIGIGPLKPRHSARRARPRGASFAKCTGCTYTQGYWKNHATWPVTALRLGDVLYSQSELVNILETAVSGNGLVQLAHQLIAQANDTCVPQAVLNAIAQADALIGSKVIPIDSVPTADTSAATEILDNYNKGAAGVPHCDKPFTGTTM